MPPAGKGPSPFAIPLLGELGVIGSVVFGGDDYFGPLCGGIGLKAVCLDATALRSLKMLVSFFPKERAASMVDIFSSSSQFVLWLCMLLASRYRWKRPIQFSVFGAIVALMAWELISPPEINVQSGIGHPLNIGLRLSTLGLILWFLFGSGQAERQA